MKNYYIIQGARYYRFLKFNYRVLKNRVRGLKSNKVGLLNHKDNYYDVTFTNEISFPNSYYGISNILKKYSNYHKKIAADIEHGVYFGKGEKDTERALPAVITFGNERLRILRSKTDRPILPIGPYIQYVDNQYPVLSIKKKIGKTILVFPIHALETISVDYNIDSFIDFINGIKNKVDAQTVLVSLYFSDIAKWASRYEAAGFKIVCSGYRTDLDFLCRQKAYFELSDYVVTNGVGTHIGYAIYTNKPVSYFDQSYLYSFERPDRIKDAMPFVDEDYANACINSVKKMFQGINLNISKEQQSIIEKFWGLSIKKKPEEIRSYLKMANYILSKSKFSNKGFKQLAIDYIQKVDYSEQLFLRQTLE